MNWATVFPNCLREKFPRPIGLIETPGTLSDKGFNLLQGLLTLCPAKRLSAEDALQHPWCAALPLHFVCLGALFAALSSHCCLLHMKATHSDVTP